MLFCRFRNQRSSPESPSYYSQARTPPTNIKIEPSTQLGLHSDSFPVTTVDQSLLKRRHSSPQISQIKTESHGYKPPLKKHQSNLPGPLSPKSERKLCPLKSRAQDSSLQNTETIHKKIISKVVVDKAAPLLSAKEELKIVDELKARRDRLLRSIEQKCEDECRDEMKPCSIMLRLEIMHGGYAKSYG